METEKPAKRLLYVYETSPLDHWEKWQEYWLAQRYFYDLELSIGTNHISELSIRTAKGNCLYLEKLLMAAIDKCSYFFKDLRGETIKFTNLYFSDPPESFNYVNELALGIKADNNGACYCLTYAKNAEKHIPHDFYDEWRLVGSF